MFASMHGLFGGWKVCNGFRGQGRVEGQKHRAARGLGGWLKNIHESTRQAGWNEDGWNVAGGRVLSTQE